MPNPPIFTTASAARFPTADGDLDEDAEFWSFIDKAAASRLAAPIQPFRNPRPLPPPSAARPHKSPRLADPTDNRIFAPPNISSPRIPPENRIVVRGNVSSPRTPLAVLPPDQGRGNYQPGGNRIVSRGDMSPLVGKGPLVESPESEKWQGRVWVKEESPVTQCGLNDFLQGEGKENVGHCLGGQFPSVAKFKQYQNAALEILDKTDYTLICGNPFIKKSGWRKIACFFDISFENKEKIIEFDDNRNVLRAEFVVRAHMRCGRFSDGWGSCDRREKKYQKPNNDIPSTAETRAKSKACSDLLGIGGHRRNGT